MSDRASPRSIEDDDGVASPSQPAVWVIAHRGASRDCPENTAAAFEEGLRQGADAIELDVQLSRDGVPVVYHDRTLVRAGGGRRRVSALDLAELRALDAGEWFAPSFRGEPIPTLAQVLRRFGRRTRLLIEIKARQAPRAWNRHAELARTVVAQVVGAGLHDRVFVLSFDVAVLREVAAADSAVARVLNLAPPRRPGRTLRAVLADLSAVAADVRSLTPAFGEALRAAGVPLFAYTCNTADRVERALRAGACGVISDRPAWLADRLRGPRR